MPYILQNLIWNDGVEESTSYKVKHVLTKEGGHIYKGKKICELANEAEKRSVPIKARFGGVVSKVLIQVGDDVLLGNALIEIKACTHPTILGNICCDCGIVLEPSADQSKEDEDQGLVSMLHSVPDLKVSKEEATRLGKEDIHHLLDKRKLVLLVDLDQTLIHTTNDNIPPKLKDVFHFQLIQNGPWYHTRLRPFTSTFLLNISKLYELHICTFGVREYAHCIAHFLDPDRKLFGDRILSRNECLDPMSKKANLSSLFPCGDNLVCIIDDRSDVWNFAPNVVQVMPYHFFQHTGDINAPPGLQKKENDITSKGFDFSHLEDLSSTNKRKRKRSGSDEEKSDVSSHDEERSKEDSDDSMKSDALESKLGEEKMHLADRKEEEEQEEVSALVNPKEHEEKQKEKSPPVDEEQHSRLHGLLSKEDQEQGGAKLTREGEKEDSGEPESKEKGSSPPISASDSMKENTSSSEDEQSPQPSQIQSEVQNNDSDTVDVEDSDDYLLYLEEILKRLHSRFYELYMLPKRNASSPAQKEYASAPPSLPDLKEIVPIIRKKVLAGSHLVFSGIVPQSVNLRESKAFHIATSLGATVTGRVVARAKKDTPSDGGAQIDFNFLTTHVVAANLHTEKVHQAKRLKHVKIVTPNWLWCCAERWEHADERLFKLNDEAEKNLVRNPPMHCFVNVAAALPRKMLQITVPEEFREEQPLFDSLNPLAFLSNDETKSMEEEVDDLLSSEEENNPKDRKKQDTESSDSAEDEESHPESTPKGSSDEEAERKRKRVRIHGDEDDDDEEGEEEEEELPSIRFRQGGALPSDESEVDSADDDINAYGDILERELLRE